MKGIIIIRTPISVLVIITMLILCFSPVSVHAETSSYTDLTQGSWYYDSVNYVTYKEYMVGVGNNKFAPEKTVTRAETVQVFYAMARRPQVKGDISFADVSAEQWFSEPVTFAADNQIVAGYPDKTFRPQKAITREEFAVMLYSYAKYDQKALTAETTLDSFPDNENVSSYAKSALSWAVGNHLIAGTDSGLEPKSFITRAQLAKIVDAYHFQMGKPENLNTNDPEVFSELMDEANYADGAYAEFLAQQLHHLRGSNSDVFSDVLEKKDYKTQLAVKQLIEYATE